MTATPGKVCPSCSEAFEDTQVAFEGVNAPPDQLFAEEGSDRLGR